MNFGSPVAGGILPRFTFGDHGELRPAGDARFEVTSTFAEHVASGRGLGTDIGNARCGEPLLAMEAGTTYERRTSAEGALIIRIQHANGWSTGYAHLASYAVGSGVTVNRGQIIGYLGTSGATACHLHFDVSLNEVRQDPIPLITLGGDMDPSFVAAGNRTLNLRAGARHRQAPQLSAAVQIQTQTAGPLMVLISGAPTKAPILGTVIGDAVNGNGMWYVYWQPGTRNLLYIHSSAADIAEFDPAGGFTQAQLDAAVAKAAMDAKVAGAKAAAEATAQAAAAFAASLPSP